MNIKLAPQLIHDLVERLERNFEAYKAVIYEVVVKVGGVTMTPDYSFRQYVAFDG